MLPRLHPRGLVVHAPSQNQTRPREVLELQAGPLDACNR